MKVVVTGAGGFVGRSLVDALLGAGGPGAAGPIERLVHLDRTPSPLADRRVVSIAGDIADPACRARSFEGGADCVFHLAAVPGGSAEADPAASQRINVDATLALAEEAASIGARFVYASTIAVLGAPSGPVHDETEPSPVTVYGRHKRQVEIALATLFASRALRASSVRLPGIVARPRGETGLKSAFLSDIFHALLAGEAFVCPVSPTATIWLMSVRRAADNLVHASRPEVIEALGGQPVTLPAVRTSMAELAAAIAAGSGATLDALRYAPDAALEAIFGRLPPLSCERARAAGFRDDGGLADLVASVRDAIQADIRPASAEGAHIRVSRGRS